MADERLHEGHRRAFEDLFHEAPQQAMLHLAGRLSGGVDVGAALLPVGEVAFIGELLHHRHDRRVGHLALFENALAYVGHGSFAERPDVMEDLHLRLAQVRQGFLFAHDGSRIGLLFYFNNTT